MAMSKFFVSLLQRRVFQERRAHGKLGEAQSGEVIEGLMRGVGEVNRRCG